MVFSPVPASGPVLCFTEQDEECSSSGMAAFKEITIFKHQSHHLGELVHRSETDLKKGHAQVNFSTDFN